MEFTGLHAMKMDGLLWIALFLLPGCAVAQTNAPGQFSCDPKLRAEFDDEHLRFDELTSADAIQQWKAHPALRFDGFDAATTGFTRVEFYRWHVPVPSREGYDQGAMSNSIDRLALAVHVVGPKAERWFEVANVEQESDESLFIQRWGQHDSDSNPSNASPGDGASSKPDEMAEWLHLQLATPDTKMPLFHLVLSARLQRGISDRNHRSSSSSRFAQRYAGDYYGNDVQDFRANRWRMLRAG